jgi:pimeloyl-ACP methyl ester carboxylesterase
MARGLVSSIVPGAPQQQILAGLRVASQLWAAALANARNTIDVPCLYIGAEHDVILPPASADGMEDFIPDLEKYTVRDSGHWTQQEQPEEVNRVILDWLGRKMVLTS